MNPNPSAAPAPRAITRRTAVKLAAVGLAGGALGAGASALITRSHHHAIPSFKHLTSDEAMLLTAMCEQIIPRDDMPGATDAGVIHFIDRQLGGKHARHRESYRRGLAAFRETCFAEFKRSFEQLSSEKQTEAMTRLEAGNVPKELWADPTAPQFFRLVLGHTMQGFYGPPRHGGNRGYASYRMLGIDYPQVIGQNRPRKERP